MICPVVHDTQEVLTLFLLKKIPGHIDDLE